jgi:protein-S-isoprenylcysteine O-methyltransferase Ste14
MRTVRIILGYLLSFTVFALAIPAAIIALGGGVDVLFRLPRWHGGPANVIIAIVLGAWGLTWMIWSWWYLFTRGRGHPTEAFGVEVTPVTQQLVTGGPYAHTRNPMVFGYVFVMLAIAALNGSAGMLVAIVLLSVIGWVNIVFFEEPRLARRFGAAYLDYKRRVRRFLPSRWRAYRRAE